MDKARVALFEDNTDVLVLLNINLNLRGHEIAFEAVNMHQARTAIEGSDEAAFDVAIVDANLDEGAVLGDNGNEIALLLRASKVAKVAIISFSASCIVQGADRDAGKDVAKVLAFISEL